MGARRVIGSCAVFVLGLSGVVALGAGCSSAGDGAAGAPEKVAATSEAYVVQGPQPPTFPDGLTPYTCQVGIDPRNQGPIPRSVEHWAVFPTQAGVVDYANNTDPHQTPYSHDWRWPYGSAPCNSTDEVCNHLTAVFSIPSANGYKYLVQQVEDRDGRWQLTGYQFLMIGLAQENTSWTYWPPRPWWSPTLPPINQYSYPPDGTDYKSADWGQLWNVVFTYGDYGVYGYPPGNKVESTLHTCVTVHPASWNGAGWSISNTPSDYFVAADVFDPNGPPPW
jgi:hypothetical protein